MLTDCKICGIPHFRQAIEYNHEYDPVIPDWDDSADQDIDPDKTLKGIRTLITEVFDSEGEIDDPMSHLEALASTVNALDEWLSQGNFKPRAWSRTRLS
jgi:hypothetical protein